MDSSNTVKGASRRLFVGIRVDYSQQLQEFVRRIKGDLINNDIRWTGTNNYHITNAFIGSVDLQKAEEINTALLKGNLDLGSFTLNIKGLGYFGKSKPRVLWCGVEKSQILELLTQKILELLNSQGVCLDSTPGTPHITLGRIKRLDSEIELDKLVKSYSEQLIQTINVNEIALFESKTYPDGPQYTAFNTFDLS